MKIQPQHFEHMKTEITTFIDKLCKQNNCTIDHIVHDYEEGLFPNSDKTKDLNKRFRWDLFHGAGLTKFACDSLYSYMDDTHIDTALRSICPQGLARNF